MMNCDVAYEKVNGWSSYQGIVIKDGATNMLIRNNIVSQNGTVQIVADGTVSVDHNYIGDNPLFYNTAEGNFTLKSNSPAVNQGSSVDAPSVDFDGKARPQGGAYDIGAYER